MTGAKRTHSPPKAMVAMIALVVSIICYPAKLRAQYDVWQAARSGNVEAITGCFEPFGKWPRSAIDTLNPAGHAALTLAVYHAQTEAVETLLALGANPNMAGPDGTPLMAAAIKGHVDIARMLLSNNADPNVTDSRATTALMLASMAQHEEMVRLLLENGADKFLRDANGNSALDYALKNQNSVLIILLSEP